MNIILKRALAGNCKLFEGLFNLLDPLTSYIGCAKRSSTCKNREKNITRWAGSRFHTKMEDPRRARSRLGEKTAFEGRRRDRELHVEFQQGSLFLPTAFNFVVKVIGYR